METMEELAIRAQGRADAGFIQELTTCLWHLAHGDYGDCTLADIREQAAEMVCFTKGCTNRPTGNTPDGRGHCGVHAWIMD